MDHVATLVEHEHVQRALRDMYMSELHDSIDWKIKWQRIANGTMAFSKFAVGLAAICDFVAGFYGLKEFTFAAGCISTFSLVLIGYSSSAHTQARRSDFKLRKILATVKFDLPETPIILPERMEMAIESPTPSFGGSARREGSEDPPGIPHFDQEREPLQIRAVTPSTHV